MHKKLTLSLSIAERSVVLAVPAITQWACVLSWPVLRYVVLACSLATLVVDAHALTPQEIYREAERQVVVLEVLDEKGAVFSYHTALLLEKGKVVTQCDSVEGVASVRLRQGDAVYPAQVERKDIARNLCLLGAPGVDSSLSKKLRDSYPVVGAQVYALSNALGMGISIAEGVVSGIRISRGESYIQFTAAIAPGSEGGGLFDANGGLVGMINYRQRDGQNVNFALPARWLNEIEQRAASSDEAEAWGAKALVLEREAKWQDLADHASGWSQTLRDKPDAWLWLGYAQEQRKNWPAAEQAYREALQIDPSIIQAGIGLATAQLAQSKPQEALGTARALLTYRQEDAGVWLTIANAESAIGHPDEAKQAFERTAQLDPWNRAAHTGLAGLARVRGDWAGAVAAQRQIVRIDPQDTVAWAELAEVYIRANRAERALTSAERAIELTSDNGDAWIFKGEALYLLKRHREAIDALKKGLALQPQRLAWGWGRLGDVYYYGLYLYPEAIAAFREALRLEPGSTEFKARLGIALKDDLQPEEALSLFEQFKVDYPNDPFSWRQIGYVRSGLAQPDAAILAYEKSLSLDSRQPKVWRALMEAYHATGRQDDVKRAYQKLLTIDTVWAEQAYQSLMLPYGMAP